MRFQHLIKPIAWTSVVLTLGYLMFAPIYFKVKYQFNRSGCMSQLKQITLACSHYTQDYEGRFPAISRGEEGWADTLQPYLKTYSIFHCPTVKQSQEARTVDYFFSARVANVKISQLKFANQTISFGEGLARGGTNSHFSELPFDWRDDENSPAQRHLTGASYAFVDGHVKWLRPDKISTQPPMRGDNWIATFAVR